MNRTLLALQVPGAEPLVGDLRARLDPSAKLGLGPHFTLVYPFHDAHVITQTHRDALAAVASRHNAMAFELDTVGTFPSTVWMAPSKDAGIIALANALEAAFPDRPRTGRQFEHFTPHLSVARNVRGASDRDAVVHTLEERLAHRHALCRCDAIDIMARLESGWRSIARFPLKESKE
jgi:2'-5' RNA ligase